MMDNYQATHKITLLPDAARAFMATAKYRLIKRRDSGLMFKAPFTYNELKIKYDGKWLSVCRTDLMDDVATGDFETRTREERIAAYTAGIVYGVRVSDRCFKVIDSATDG